MHLGLAVILQVSCVKCGQIFSIKNKPRVQTSRKNVDGQLGHSSWEYVHWWWFDTVEPHTSTYGCPWYAKANVHRY